MPRSVASLRFRRISKPDRAVAGRNGHTAAVALRCRIVFGGRGESEAAIASALEVNRKTVRLWRERSPKEAEGSVGR